MPPERRLRLLAAFFSGTALLVAGCHFVPVHEVSVDAISALTTPLGQAYRLADKDPMAVRNTAQHKQVFACVAAALDTKGVFEAPAGTKPDFTVEIDYGTTRTAKLPGMAGVMVPNEYFLQLSGRRMPAADSPGRGEEVWNVRTSVMEDQVDLNFLLPVLAAAAADYAGLDTQIEKTIKVAENAPAIIHIKAIAEEARVNNPAPAPAAK